MMKAAPNDIFAYYFQHLICVREQGTCYVYADRYQVDPAFPVMAEGEELWISAEDVRRIYAPYLSFGQEESLFTCTYGTPDIPERRVALLPEQVRCHDQVIYVEMCALAALLDKRVVRDGAFTVIAIDAPADAPSPVAGFPQKLSYLNRIHGKDRGEMDFTLWYEPADRLIPYRMYVPSGYDPAVPHRTVVCFHGGDANCDYMFRLTDNEIERVAEKRNYILLALTSYRKFTFFGGSKVPTSTDHVDMTVDNPIGLDEDQWNSCQVAEASAIAQIQDAMSRYHLDPKQMYAMGNSGGALGIFRQVQYLARPFFRAVVTSGGIAHPESIDYELVKSTGTKFLVMYGSEDYFDGQQILRGNMQALLDHGLDARLQIVGGGLHLTAWTHALEDIFDFFRENAGE